MSTLRLRPLETADLPTLAGFLGAPHVARWWHEDADVDAVAEKYGPVLRGEEPTCVLLVLEDERPVGMVQHYRWSEQDAAPYGLPAGAAGIDYLIGHPHDCDRGLGSRLVGAVLDLLPDGVDVWVTPEQANGPSCRVLENNGFELMAVKQCQVPDEPWAGPTALYRLKRAH